MGSTSLSRGLVDAFAAEVHKLQKQKGPLSSSNRKTLEAMLASVPDISALQQQEVEATLPTFAGVCSGSCQCVQHAMGIQRACSTNEMPTPAQMKRSGMDTWATTQTSLHKAVTGLAAKLLDPAAGHRLHAAQNALEMFRA
jgi:hypothetical protein